MSSILDARLSDIYMQIFLNFLQISVFMLNGSMNKYYCVISFLNISEPDIWLKNIFNFIYHILM